MSGIFGTAGLRPTAELDVCHACAVVLVNGDDSADPERAERAADAAYAVWGDALRDLVCADEEEARMDSFRCDYCREDTHDYRHAFVLLGR